MSISIDREELAWAAGFFDGEGNTCLIKAAAGERIAVQISSTYQPALERFLKAVQIGHINGPYQRGTFKPQWAYRVNSFRKCQAVIAMLWPFLSGEKRAQAAGALSRCIKSVPYYIGPELPPHATVGRYKRGCRCRPCRVAKSAYRGVPEELRRGPRQYSKDNPPPHGTANRYKHHSCRCPECRSAAREARRRNAA